MLVGSSRLAGWIGAYNSLRALGEVLLLKKKIWTQLLNLGSAYMNATLENCILKAN